MYDDIERVVRKFMQFKIFEQCYSFGSKQHSEEVGRLHSIKELLALKHGVI